jgi:hypothetical protein
MSCERTRLSQTERIARRDHYCDNCEGRIFPGDLYEIIVEVHKNGRYKAIWMRKEHIHPSCPPPEDEWDRKSFVLTNIIQFRMAA